MPNEQTSQRVVRILAVVTAVVSLAPIGLGSLVTTLGAGMAFPDWPTSNGQAMLAYPWLSSSGDKFVEHGHRLAGMLIGFCSLVLAVVAWVARSPHGIRMMTLIVVAGVIVQGLIGGLRVRLDRQTIAFVHSLFGCLVFVALWLTAQMTSSRWVDVRRELHSPSKLKIALVFLYPSVCLLQYTLGGFIRHLGLLVHEHLGGALAVAITATVVVRISLKSPSGTVHRAAAGVGIAVSLQVVIGLFVWCTKYGFPPMGLVAVQHSLLQVVSRSLHTVAGMTVVLTAVTWSMAVWRTKPVRIDVSDPLVVA